jgi:hypothetical protein
MYLSGRGHGSRATLSRRATLKGGRARAEEQAEEKLTTCRLGKSLKLGRAVELPERLAVKRFLRLLRVLGFWCHEYARYEERSKPTSLQSPLWRRRRDGAHRSP